MRELRLCQRFPESASRIGKGNKCQDNFQARTVEGKSQTCNNKLQQRLRLPRHQHSLCSVEKMDNKDGEIVTLLRLRGQLMMRLEWTMRTAGPIVPLHRLKGEIRRVMCQNQIPPSRKDRHHHLRHQRLVQRLGGPSLVPLLVLSLTNRLGCGGTQRKE